MKRICILPIDFMGQGAMLQPVDVKLHDLAVEFCAKELAEHINFTRLTKVWAAVEMEDGEYKQVIGITGYVLKIDVPVFRAAGPDSVKASALMIDRLRSYFTDNGSRGAEVFIHISSKETPVQKCDKWRNLLTYIQAEPADRWAAKV